MAELIEQQELPNGPVAAALLAGGIGATAVGLLTVLAEAFPAIKTALNWWNPAGPLTGKSLGGVAIFFIAWILLHNLYRGKEVAFNRIILVAYILLFLGLVGTFPPFFELFTAH